MGILDAEYGFTMASNYNQRRRPAEVLIQSDGTARLIRRRRNPEIWPVARQPVARRAARRNAGAVRMPTPDLSTSPRAIWRLTWPQMLAAP